MDNSETITTDELLLVMKNLGMMATKEEVKEMLSEVDEDGMHFKFFAGVDIVYTAVTKILSGWVNTASRPGIKPARDFLASSIFL